MWSLGLWMVAIGYAFAYTGWMNLRNGGAGPTILESLGVNKPASTTAPKSGQTGSRDSASGVPQPKAV